MFDPKKPVRTRDGRQARIICTDRKDRPGWRAIPYVALVVAADGGEDTYWYHEDGTCHNKVQELDLINIPEKHTLRGWVNVYPPGQVYPYSQKPEGSRFYSTRTAADEWAMNQLRIACIEISREFEEGEGL